MGPEQASQLQAQYARRAGPIGLTVEELDFEHFPVKNGFPGIPRSMPGRRRPRK